MKTVLLLVISLGVVLSGASVAQLQQQASLSDSPRHPPRALSAQQKQLGLFTLDEHQKGGVVVYIVMTLYLGGIMYILYTKFIFINIEEIIFLINSNVELLRPVFYCFLNSLVFLMANLFSLLVNKSNMGLSVSLGTDMTSLLLLFGLILKRHYHEQTLSDSYIYFRDMVYYILGLVLLVLMMMLNTLTWYIALVPIFYYILYYVIQSQNDKIKEKLMLLVGATKEEDNFNSEEHFHYIKRRQSITNLVGFHNKDDPHLQQSLRRVEQKPVPQGDKPQVYYRFRRVVTALIWALRMQTKGQKQRRADFYERLFTKDKKKPRNEEGQQMMQRPEEEGSEQGYMEAKNDSKASSDSEEEPGQQLQQVNDSQTQEGAQGFSLTFPRNSFMAQLFYVLYFPVYLLFSLFPNTTKLEAKNRLVMLSLLNLVSLGFGVYFLMDWMHIIAEVLGMKNETMGLTLGNLLFSMAFLNYNLKLASEEQDIEFMQSFLQLGIFKIGIALGISYLVATIYDDNIEQFVFRQGSAITKLAYVTLLYILLSLITVLVLVKKKFRFDRQLANVFIALYVLLMGVMVGLIQAV